jgi:hypothetical protein
VAREGGELCGVSWEDQTRGASDGQSLKVAGGSAKN